MNREVTFRGLTTKGKWVYGSLVTTNSFIKQRPKQHTKTWIVESAFGNGGWFNILKRSYVKPDTVAIHFPKMIDKNGKKIFASLNDSGIGGDIVLNFDKEQGALVFDEFGSIQYYEQFENFEVVGIQEHEHKN